MTHPPFGVTPKNPPKWGISIEKMSFLSFLHIEQYEHHHLKYTDTRIVAFVFYFDDRVGCSDKILSQLDPAGLERESSHWLSSRPIRSLDSGWPLDQSSVCVCDPDSHCKDLDDPIPSFRSSWKRWFLIFGSKGQSTIWPKI